MTRGASQAPSPKPQAKLWLGVLPVLADADVDRRAARSAGRRAPWRRARARRRRSASRLGRLEQQLVVDGQDHAARRRRGRRCARSSAACDVDHRLLEHVGRRALNRHVHGLALGGQRAPCRSCSCSSGTRRRRPVIVRTTPVARASASVLVDVRAHAREAGEVRVDELLRGLLRHADVLGERERRLPVEQRVVDDLRAAPQLVLVEAARSLPNTRSAVRSWMSIAAA